MKLLAILILCLFSGCSGFLVKDHIVDDFYLIATDSPQQSSLSFCDPGDNEGCAGIIKATVFAIGFNTKYIIAKQHPSNNKSITQYFIVPIKLKDKVWGNYFGLIGPLSLKQFNSKRLELNIPDSVTFTKVIHELE